MFGISHAVVSVFALAVLLNVFYFDPAQSYETSDIYESCEVCIKSPCHTQNGHACAQGAGNYTLCFKCDKQTLDHDQQYYSQSECKGACSDPSKCRCDDGCWVCVLKGNPNAMQCANLQKVYDDNCNLIPYTPQ